MKKIVTKISGYNQYDNEIKNDNGELLYTEHIKEPIYTEYEEDIEVTQNELNNIELNELRAWFDVEYSKQEQKLRRLHTLGKLTDNGNNAYNALIELYKEAEIKRARIQELEALINE